MRELVISARSIADSMADHVIAAHLCVVEEWIAAHLAPQAPSYEKG